MTFSLLRSHWVFSTAFLLLSLIGGQQVSADICPDCYCSPDEIEFKLNFIPDACNATNTNVENSHCDIAYGNEDAVGDLSEAPSNLMAMRIQEYGMTGGRIHIEAMLHEEYCYNLDLWDENTFIYTRPDRLKGSRSTKLVLVLDLFEVSFENHLVHTIELSLQNDCGLYPLVEKGQKIGVLEIIRVGSLHSPGLCPAETCWKDDYGTPAPSEPCSDDPNFDRDPENPGVENCAWVAEKPQSRCTLDEDIPAACQRTCKAECKCVNDPSFMHVDDLNQEGCDWVKDNLNRCNQDGVGTSCPEVCNPYCSDQCSNDRYFMRNNDPEKNCDWITEKSASRCTLDSQVSLSCPATCSSDCCSDTQNFKFNGERSKNCNWVADNPEVRCPKRSSTGESVADNCPSVCNPFCSQRKNLRG